MSNKKNKGISRRDVLRYGAATGTVLAAMGPLGRHILPEASGAIATQKHLTILNLFGGCDWLHGVFPAQGAASSTLIGRRPTIGIDPQNDPVHPLVFNGESAANAQYAMHPQFNNIGRLYGDGDVAVINLVGYPQPNLSHFTSEDIWSRGLRADFPVGTRPSGWIARYVDQFAPSPTGAISVGLGRRRDFTGGNENPLVISQTSRFNFDDDGRYRDNFAYRMDIIRDILDTDTTLGPAATARVNNEQAHALIASTQQAITDYENFAGKATYTGETPSRYMQDIARLIHGGFNTRIFYTGFGGFDTHGDQGTFTTDPNSEPRMARLIRRLDDAIGSFEADMKAMNTWDNTVVMVISEFGRRCFENGSNGTDHGHGLCVLLVGGGVTGGVYGPDLTEDLINQNWLPGLVDFRAIYREVLEGHLGAGDASGLFPEQFLDPYQPMGLIS